MLRQSNASLERRRLRTSLLVTGFSSRLTCVSFGNPCSASRSASSLTLFCVRTKVLRLGILLGKLGCMLAIRFRAHSRVCSRGESGKLARTEISLSVKSMASRSYHCTVSLGLVPDIFGHRSLNVLYAPLRPHPGSQWSEFCALYHTFVSTSSRVVSALFRDIIWVGGRTSEV